MVVQVGQNHVFLVNNFINTESICKFKADLEDGDKNVSSSSARFWLFKSKIGHLYHGCTLFYEFWFTRQSAFFVGHGDKLYYFFWKLQTSCFAMTQKNFQKRPPEKLLDDFNLKHHRMMKMFHGEIQQLSHFRFFCKCIDLDSS